VKFVTVNVDRSLEMCFTANAYISNKVEVMF